MFHPISVLKIKELWIGQGTGPYDHVWGGTAVGIRGAFEVLTKVEELSIVNCIELFFATLGAIVDDGILLPRLQRLTAYVEYKDLDASALVRCARTRKVYSRWGR